MIEFRWNNRKPDGTPIIKDKEIEKYAELILREYKPDSLIRPYKIKPDHFLESYLRVNIDYQYIYNSAGVGVIAGEAIFNNGQEVEIFDTEKMSIETRRYNANTVIIDQKAIDDKKDDFVEFTHLHEGGHIFLHQDVYTIKPKQPTIFPLEENSSEEKVYFPKCYRAVLENPNKGKLVTPENFREHHANVFAAAIAMHPIIFNPTAREIIKSYGFSDGICIVSSYANPLDWNSIIDARDYAIVDDLSELFTGSKTAIRVQLQKQKLLMTEEEYRKLNTQNKLF